MRVLLFFFFFKQKTAYEIGTGDWSSDVCSSDLSGIAEGMKSTWASLLVVVVAIIAAFSFAGGTESFLLGLYGVGIAAVGMLSTLGITLATDA